MEGRSKTQLSPDPSFTFLFSFALQLEGGNAPYSIDAVPLSYVSTYLLIYVHPAPSSEFSLLFEMEGGTDASTISVVPTSYEFSFSFAFEIDVGTAPSSAAAVPPSYGSTALLVSVHPAPSSGF